MKKIWGYKQHSGQVRTISVLTLAVILTVGTGSLPSSVQAVSCTSTSDCTQKINSLSATQAQSQQLLSSLKSQATSYQDAIARLDQQISTIQTAIASSQSQEAALQQEITTAQANLVQQKQVMSTDLTMEYVNGGISTTEMLASSENLSAFADSETYRSAVQAKIQDTLNTINTLETQLKTQKTEVDQLLQSQQAQQAQLSSAQAEQVSLASYNASQQASYNAQIKSNAAQLSSLQAQNSALQALESGVSTDAQCGAGYPYCTASCFPPDSGPSCGDYDWGYQESNGSISYYDKLGYSYRNCTSYVAWRLTEVSSDPAISSLVSGLGNAAQWPANASSRGVPVSYGSHPQVGDAAVDPGGGGWQGHVMYVEAVNSDGSIFVSQYNQHENGTYTTATITDISGLDFIHFPGV